LVRAGISCPGPISYLAGSAGIRISMREAVRRK